MEQLDRMGAKKIYATARTLNDLQHLPNKVEPIELELTDSQSIRSCIEQTQDATLFINNAGILKRGSVIDRSVKDQRAEMEVNFFAPLMIIKELLNSRVFKRGGKIVLINSICAFAGMPGVGGYSASKSALHSLSQSLKPLIDSSQVTMSAVYPGPLDTQMNDGIEIPDITTCETAAAAICTAIANNQTMIFPDQKSTAVWETYKRDPLSVIEEFSNY